MLKFPDPMRRLPSMVAPDLAMVNDVSRQLLEGEMSSPSLHPRRLRSVASRALGVTSPDPRQSSGRLGGQDEIVTPNSTFAFQAYLFYHRRFISACLMCSDWGSLGGFPAQINEVAVRPNLSIAESSGVAIAYGVPMRIHISKLSRLRRTDIDYAHLPSKAN